MIRSGSRAVARYLAVLAVALPCAAAAQRPSGGARLQALAFADTSWVRIEARLRGAGGGEQVALRASIVSRRGDTLWAGPLGAAASGPGGVAEVTRTIAGLRPRLWSPSSPELYTLVVAGDGSADTLRIGFRHVETRDGRVVLNGKPIFLRGNAINPPGRTIPDSLDENPRFVADYLRYMKRIGVNLIRLSRTSQVWLDGCDSLGILLYQGLYGVPRGGTVSRPPDKPFADVLADYRGVLEPLASHPSVVIYVLSNELASRDIIHRSRGADTMAAFLTRVHRALRDWDSTRVYLANAGYGFGRSGDLCDTHHYWGWYYNTVLSFYSMRDPRTCWRTPAVQPLTVSENSAAYTGPDGRFNIIPDKQLSSQLNWTGHAPDAQQSSRALAYQAWVAGQAIEIMRRTREEDPYLAGIMPFTTMFSRWSGISRFDQMAPKPVARQIAISYQPVLLSWESWTPQVYAGTTLRPTAHVVDDDTLGRDLHGVVLHWRLLGPTGQSVASATLPIGDVAYYAAVSRRLKVALPASLAQGTYTLEGRLVDAEGELSHNRTTIFVARRGFAGRTGRLARRVALFDPSGRTAAALRRLSVPFTAVRGFSGLKPGRDALVLGEGSWSVAPAGAAATLRVFVAAGGRVLVLAQQAGRFDPSWTGARLRLPQEPVDTAGDRRKGNPYRNAIAVNPERPTHPVFAGLDRDRLFLWSDPTGWTERSPGLPDVYPVEQGYVLTDPADLSHTAVLADYGPGLEGIGMAEVFQGEGSVLLSGFGLAARVGLDPVADRMLVNLVRYTASADEHFAQPLVMGPIVWGDYGSEQGLALGVYDGLIVNPVPIVPEELRARYPIHIDAKGFTYAGAKGGWNSRPAIEYVPRGRRIFGPYTLNVFSTPQLPKDAPALGSGSLWLRVPAGKHVMSTAVENPIDVPLPIEITVNGRTRRAMVPAGATLRVDVPLSPSAAGRPQRGGGTQELAVHFRADRRLVLRETAFR